MVARVLLWVPFRKNSFRRNVLIQKRKKKAQHNPWVQLVIKDPNGRMYLCRNCMNNTHIISYERFRLYCCFTRNIMFNFYSVECLFSLNLIFFFCKLIQMNHISYLNCHLSAVNLSDLLNSEKIT